MFTETTVAFYAVEALLAVGGNYLVSTGMHAVRLCKWEHCTDLSCCQHKPKQSTVRASSKNITGPAHTKLAVGQPRGI